MNRRKSIMPIAVYYSLIFMGLGAFGSYIGLYYSSINLNSMQIGFLTSAGSGIALIGQPIWGSVTDRAKYKNTILIFCLFFSTASLWLMPLSGSSFVLLSLSTLVFYFFQCAINPVSDAIALELSSAGNFSFSKIRTLGSLGYAIMSAVAGRIFDLDIMYIFIVFFTLKSFAFLLSLMIPKVKGHQNKTSKVKIKEIFKDKKLVNIYIYTFILQVFLGFFYGFHAIYSKDMGISTRIVGIGIMIGSFSQFPFMIFFDKLYNKFGIVKLMLFSGLIYSLRWLLYATTLTPAILLFTWVLHGSTFIIPYLCLAEYVNKNVIKELKAGGQMMNSIVISNLSRLFGGITGGVMATLIGMNNTFLFSFIISFTAVIWFYFISRKLSFNS